MSNNNGNIISVGFSNFVNFDRVVIVMTPSSFAGRKHIADAKEENRIIDVSMDRKVRSVILTDNNTVILSALNPETIVQRAQNEEEGNE